MNQIASDSGRVCSQFRHGVFEEDDTVHDEEIHLVLVLFD